MAGVLPDIPGTGSHIPVSTYTAGISEAYPNVNRQRIIESSINSKERVDFMPTNVGVNQQLTDRYVEFRISGVIGSFIDLSSLVLELSLKPVDGLTGEQLPDDINVGLVNGLANTLFKSASVFINEKMVESNPIYNYSSYIKQLKSMNADSVKTLGHCGFFYDNANADNTVTKHYIAGSFANASGFVESKLMSSIKTYGVDMYFPLLLDISTLDMYLLDGVDVRIRLEMGNNNWILNSNTPHNISLNIRKAKLWVDRVTPHYNALTALNQALTIKPVEYVFDKTLHKTYVIGANESSIMIDQPFGSCVPTTLTMVIVDMNAFSGSLSENGLYFDHADISNMHLTVNGTTVYNINTSFPNSFSQSYYETQKALGIDKSNLITYDSYKSGRAVFTFNFVNENVHDSLPVEISASLRINIQLGNRVTTPHVILLLAETVGLISLDSQRNVTCDVRG